MKNKILISMFLLPLSTQALSEDISALSYDDVTVFISDYSKEGKYSKAELIELFARTKIKKSIVKSSNNQPEVKLTWEKYKNKVVSKAKIDSGKVFLIDNIETLTKAENDYGVPKEIIVSIIGIESYYGKYKGNNKAINAISTMAFEGSDRRKKFFTGELKEFFNYCHNNDLDPLSLKSSWAGAFGYPQFIPSSINSYAVDFDNDGIIDLINNKKDAIGSVANYLNKKGWKKEGYIAEKASYITPSYYSNINGFKLNYTIESLKDKGGNVKRNMRQSKKLKLMEFKTEKGHEYWVGYNNFHTLTKYNRSNLYAMAIFDLANKIKGEEVL